MFVIVSGMTGTEMVNPPDLDPRRIKPAGSSTSTAGIDGIFCMPQDFHHPQCQSAINGGSTNDHIWIPKNGLFRMENPTKMDDLGVAPFRETSKES